MSDAGPAFMAGCRAYDEKLQRMQSMVATLIAGVGEDVGREGLVDTPKRVAKALLDVTHGCRQCPASVLRKALFHESVVNAGPDGIVLVRDIDFASTCEATLLPFLGRCHVAYFPSNSVVLGLSKLARLTKILAKRLQTQERLTAQLLQALESELAPRGIAVVVEARHLCYAHDGASTAGSSDPLAAPPHPRRATAATSGLFCDPALGHFDDLLCFLGLEEPSAAPEAVKPSAVLPGAPPLCSHSCCSSSSDALGRAGAAGGALEACCGPVGANLSPLVTPVLSDDLVRGEDEGEGSGSDTCEHGRCCCDSSSGSSALGPGSDMALSAGSDMALSVGSAPSCSASDAEPDGVALALADDEAAACSCGCSATGCGCAGSGGCGRGMCSGDPMQLDARWQAVAGPLGTSQQLALARWQAVNGAAPTAPATPPLPGAPAAAAAAGAATEADMQAAVAALLAELGEDPRRPGLRATAAQYVAALLASTSGYTMPAPLPEAAGGEPAAPAPAVQEFHAPFTSQCEHHMLPFHGSAHIVCLDGRRHLSPSAAAALVARFTRRLQVQERITHQLADAFAGATDASGVLVVCSAVHMCMVARGVENHAGATCTTAVRGTAASDPAVRAQCMRLVRPQLRAAAAAAGADGSGC